MPQKKYDGVIEVVRYTPDGKISEVRLYERRGPTFSDRVIIPRTELLQRLRARKKFAVGLRKPLMARRSMSCPMYAWLDRGVRK